MLDFSQYKEVGKTTNTVTYTLESDPDILLIVPLEGTKDNARDAHENVAFINNYARTLGRPIGTLVMMANMLAQEPEARRAYGEIKLDVAYGAGLVVTSALSRALGSFFIGLTRPIVPIKLFDNVDKAIDWLKSMRPH